MSKLQAGERVLVTGGSGYIATHIIKQLLSRGFDVRATVRNPDDAAKTAHLRALEGAERLELIAADLTVKGAFHEPVSGCQAVVHTASSVRLTASDPQRDIVDVAVDGTRNVFDAIDAASGVHTVVVTSSIAAVIDDFKDPAANLTEADWNESSTVERSPYPLSKTLAEREAWKRADGADYRLVTINPGLVLGPVYTKGHLRTSPSVLGDIFTGKFPMLPRFRLSVVDVRDVARAHVEALLRPEAQGRHILSHQSLWMREIAATLREAYPDRRIPRLQMPDFAMYAFAIFDKRLSWDFLRRNLGVERKLDHTKSREALGIDYLPLKDTLVDTAQSLLDAGLA